MGRKQGSSAKSAKPLDTARRWVSDLSGLVSPPDVCIKVFDLVDSPGTTSKDLGEIIGKDPNLTAQLLRVVNSPAFSPQARIETISRAVTVVGIHELYSLIIAVSAVKTFNKIPKGLINIDTFWRHSIFSGLIGRSLAQRCAILHPERLFIAGLLHDIGSMVMYHRIPETACEILLNADGDEEHLYRVEQEGLGFTHADLGAMLMEQWRLPDTLIEAVRCHHEPEQALSAPMETAIVHISNILANRSGIGSFVENSEIEGQISEHTLNVLNIDPDTFDANDLIGEAGRRFTATVDQFQV